MELTSSSVTERVARLEERGVIQGYSAIISPEKVEKPVTTFVLIESADCKKSPQIL